MKKNKDLGILIQLVLFTCTIIFFIISLFEKEFYNLAQILVSLVLFVMAYNNHKIYKRKYFSIIYIVFGSILLMNAVINIFK